MDDNGKFKIEKGVPVPSPRGGPNGKYPFADMEVGDSFFVPANGPETEKLQNIVANAAKGWIKRDGKNAGRKFATRKVEGGVRIWRIA